MQRSLLNTVSTQLRRTAAAPAARANLVTSRSPLAASPASARFLSSSPRASFPGPNPAPTASEDAVAADRGETIAEETTTTVKQTTRKVVQSDEHHDPHHPGSTPISHLDNPSLSEEAVHAEKHSTDPLPDHAKSSSKSSPAVGADEADPQHPGKIGPDHLENPSLSEAFVHADRDAVDPLKGNARNAAASAAQSAQGAAAGIANAASKVAAGLKDAVGLGGGKKSFSTSARQLAGQGQHEDNGAKPATHVDTSGHEHLDKPSAPEEEVHADKSDKDPLAGTGQKASERKGDKAGVADSPVQQSKN
ncbi:hypothetical protein JCM10212_002619 [Sporobolomyces blumeae]